MNAPAPDLSGPINDVLCRHEMHEQLGLVAVYADIAQRMLEAGDAAGTDYALRRMGAHARAAIQARNLLTADDKADVSQCCGADKEKASPDKGGGD